MDDAWRSTACILCSINCGIQVKTEGRSLAKIRGDRAHPGSKGYTCEKALRLDHYQSWKGRLTAPLHRRPDGTFEEVSWDEAVEGVARDLARVRDAHGGDAIFYYGGGGQANHLGGAFGAGLRAALGSTYASNALAQEKTGEFWVDGKLFGRPRCHTSGDFEHAEVAVFLGKNPWHSHGFPRARVVLKEIADDPSRTLVVIDPRVTETAKLADVHLRVRPGTDAHALLGILVCLFDEGLVDDAWLDAHAVGKDELRAVLGRFTVDGCARVAGLDPALLRDVARRIGRAKSVSIFEDLGIQQNRHSTLVSWLEKLVYLVTGNFAKQGGMNIHSRFASMNQAGGRAERFSPVTGQRVITGLIPCAAIPDEILTDHPKRFRAMIVESANPAHSLPDSKRMREALSSLECLVVLDVAMTETARLATWVLPVASQYEKWECAFFTLEFPENVFQLRPPLFEPLPGTLPEPEIHRRLVRALGAYTDDDLAPLREAAKAGREAFAMAFLSLSHARPDLARMPALVLAETLGPTLGEGREALAAVWGLAMTCFMSYPGSVTRAGHASGDALFEAVLAHPEGVVFTRDEPAETLARLDTKDRKVHLVVEELLPELAALGVPPPPDPAFPFVLSAGERRTSTANTIFRDPGWRKKDPDGALRMAPEDAERLGLADGGRVRVTTKRGSVETVVEVFEGLLPGHVSLPNGLGLSNDGAEVGVAPNELTSTEDRDPIAGTPFHKCVAARVEAVA